MSIAINFGIQRDLLGSTWEATKPKVEVIQPDQPSQLLLKNLPS